MIHLWEVDHPRLVEAFVQAYYCNEGNYYTSESVCSRFETWAGFMEEFGDSDMDYNMVFRWDWKIADEDNELPGDRLFIFFMGQRKGKYFYSEIDIRKEDEVGVRAWLQPRLEYLMELWAPLTPGEVVTL